MGNNATLGDADTVYGNSRATYAAALSCAVVATNTNGAQADLNIPNINRAVTASNKAGAKGHNRIFLCSEERGDEIEELLQPQQRWIAGAGLIEVDGGFKVTVYKGIKIVRSRYMDANGVLRTGGSTSRSDTDVAFYLLDMDNIGFYSVGGVDTQHVPIVGSDSGIRYDVQGGYYKTYGVFVVKRFDTQVLIYNLNTPPTS